MNKRPILRLSQQNYFHREKVHSRTFHAFSLLPSWSCCLVGSQAAPCPPPHQPLSLDPDVGQCGVILALNKVVNTGSGRTDDVARKCGLVVTLAQEVGVYERGEKRVLECHGAEDYTEENDEFGECDCLHGLVIVGCSHNVSHYSAR